MKDQGPRPASHSTQKEGSQETPAGPHPDLEATSIINRLQSGGVKSGTTSEPNLVAKAFEFIEQSEPKGATLISVLGLLCLLDIMGFAWTATGSVRPALPVEPGRGLSPEPSRRSGSQGSIDISDLSELLSTIMSLKSGTGGAGGTVATASPSGSGSGKALDPVLLKSLLSLLQQGGLG
ncbi:MAG TPA: hypothetical protein GX507_09295 [Clostridia bacterium]|nr:hypothetical protein [Clostridia bacterium]